MNELNSLSAAVLQAGRTVGIIEVRQDETKQKLKLNKDQQNTGYKEQITGLRSEESNIESQLKSPSNLNFSSK